jgi:hypothetical protein
VSLRISSNILITDPDGISSSIVAGGDIINHVVDFRCNIGYIGGRANKFSIEASANVYSLPRRSRSALGTDSGNYIVALINSLSRFLERSYYIYRLSILYISQLV